MSKETSSIFGNFITLFLSNIYLNYVYSFVWNQHINFDISFCTSNQAIILYGNL